MRFRMKNIGQTIKKNRFLRVLVLLCGILAILTAFFLTRNISYRQEAAKIRTQIEANDLAFANLQKMALEEQKKAIQESLFEKKSFSNFEEVIPFIAYLEKLFSAIDPEAQITIKNQEGQIFLDHFADYNVDLKMKPEGKEWLFKALNQLYESRFVIKPMSFTLYYNPVPNEDKNELQEIILTIRLYLK